MKSREVSKNVRRSARAVVAIDRDTLVFRFPAVHRDARLSITFMRTLRIPDDGKEYPLPPGLGAFPLRDVDGYAEHIPALWAEQGGVMLPMYQSEALWMLFRSSGYPFAVQVSTGGVSCLTGRRVRSTWTRRPQNYVVVPEQPWLDGHNVGGNQIRQFVAAPLDHEASVEKQITGTTKVGGMRIRVRPMTAAAWKGHRRDGRGGMLLCDADAQMGFAAGGKMRQEIYADPYEAAEWAQVNAACSLWVCNSLMWRGITGEAPLTKPPEPAEYRRFGVPWFDYFNDAKLVSGSKALASLKSYKRGRERVSVSPRVITKYRRLQGVRVGQVRTLDG